MPKCAKFKIDVSRRESKGQQAQVVRDSEIRIIKIHNPPD